jgi:predicted RNase H-like HicB family nuclease
VKSHIYTVVIHEAEEGGYWTSVPALPGAGSQGETLDEALAMTREAIELMIESLTEDGLEVPEDAQAARALGQIVFKAA